jgi:uncharacterized membrane protein
VGVDVLTEAVIERPVDVVASFAADPSNVPRWYHNISSVEWLTDPVLAPGSRIAFVAHFLGRRIEYVYEIVEYVPGELLVMRSNGKPFAMETTYTWEDAGAGRTRMTLRNAGEPSGFAAIGAKALAVAMRAANTKDLRQLKAVLEER